MTHAHRWAVRKDASCCTAPTDGYPPTTGRERQLPRRPFGFLHRLTRDEMDANEFLTCPPTMIPRMDMRDVEHIVFYNHFHNGDVYLARGILEGMVRAYPNKRYTYAHGCPPDLLRDIDAIRHDGELLRRLPKDRPYMINKPAGTVFINTWIGCLGPSIVQQRGGVNIVLLHQILAATVKRTLGADILPLAQCVPDPDYSKFHIQTIREFAESDTRRKILISNGNPLSGQSAPFDFTPFVARLARHFPDVLFILTNSGAPEPRLSNVIHSTDIIQKKGPDLNENGYLSTFCDAIIGRSSGAYTYSINQANLRTRKLFLSFVNLPIEASLGFDEPVFSGRCLFIASNDYREHFMLRRMIQGVQAAVATGPFPSGPPGARDETALEYR